MKPKANAAVRLVEEHEENQDMQALLDLIKKQAELDKKLKTLLVVVSASGD